MTSAPRKIRWLYLLASFQLVAGPLVLVTVTTFCKITVRETPSLGVVKAMSVALHSDEVTMLVNAASDAQRDDSQSSLPVKKTKSVEKKITAVAWQPLVIVWAEAAPVSAPVSEHRWTPAWPQPPPGPPPRVG